MSKSTELSATSKPLTILHTSDWHLGRRLYGQLRYDEFQTFLEWLTETIKQYKVDVLIVAGDIFDTMTPSNRAQSLYYEFLGVVSNLYCEHVVVVAGNHDSPTFLDAPANVLKFLNVHVVGTACENVADEVLVLNDKQDKPQCIIAAVPYLRDRDVRNSNAGESGTDKDANLLAGIKQHYSQVADIAKAKQAELTQQEHRDIPIIATGHLFAAGGRTTEDDGVRELYVGNLGKISADMFADCFDYVALGHLHVPQRVGGCEHIRYSGSPIAMGFGEAKQQKQVLLIQFGNSINESFESIQPLSSNPNDSSITSASETLFFDRSSKTSSKPDAQTDLFMDDLFAGIDDAFNESNSEENKIESASEEIPTNVDSLETNSTDLPTPVYHDQYKCMHIMTVPIPTFQKLVQIKGDMVHIESAIADLPRDNAIWLEIIYEGNEIVSNLNEQVQSLIQDTPFKALKIKNSSVYNKVLKSESANETLQDLDEKEVFERCMTMHDIADSQKDALRLAYQQILYDVTHEDVNSGEV